MPPQLNVYRVEAEIFTTFFLDTFFKKIALEIAHKFL